MENFKIADFTLDVFRLEKSSRDFQRFWHIRKVKPNFSRYLPSRSESLVVLHCFLETAKSFFPALARLWLYMSAEIKKIPDCLKKLRCIFRFQLFWLNGICRKNLSLNIIFMRGAELLFQRSSGRKKQYQLFQTGTSLY